MHIKHRIYGLDTLRAVAIILVLMYHYVVFVSREPTFGFLSDIGWVGVDLFFVLSGYLIGNQIFSSIAKQRIFSLKSFYYRRLLRTLPNYLLILGMYFLIPAFKEHEVLPPLWKFLTFTQNFGLNVGTAFSHAWSLCIEEQFYLIFPALTLWIVYTKSFRASWVIMLGAMVIGIILRSSLWIYYVQNAEGPVVHAYYSKIYYSSFCRLDELILGVSIAMMKNFRNDAWMKITEKGNLILLFGVSSSILTLYLFSQYHYTLFMAALGFPLLAISFAALTIAALCPASYLHNIKIPGTANLAIWSYAIYLIHKPLMVMTHEILLQWGLTLPSLSVLLIMFISIFSGWLLYTCVEAPFLKIRDKYFKITSIAVAKSDELLHQNPGARDSLQGV
ncbi:MAG: acyltransferase [Legionellales bacterium]|nr:acyltransferase [Legionellales bacterium]